ncbi:hypothetical protein [Micropruina sonneratiae]|uniref:hypothetical protein n=1 Tax=Micropruina sonneratiae TaxID=2986940 RepID=UPI0022273158|nr:hypothetical protein [Micropruina sp. KQZ13P-5]MCW3158966.1 hypothetical protein [Micropruina sp. KQZ13P-5]
MPKPQWGWFAVAVVATATGIWLISSGLVRIDSTTGPPGGLAFALIALVAVWAFGKAFFNFPDYRKRK